MSSSRVPTLSGEPRRSSTFDLSSSFRSSCGFNRSWFATYSSSISSQSFILSNLSWRSLHFAVGTTVGNFVPNAEAPGRLRCFFPTLGGGGGGSYFFLCSCTVIRLINIAVLFGSSVKICSNVPLSLCCSLLGYSVLVPFYMYLLIYTKY